MDEEEEKDKIRERVILPAYAEVKREFLKWRSPKRGDANPQIQTNPVWTWIFAKDLGGYQLNHELGGPDSLKAGPAWACQRYGQPLTVLPDGTAVFTGGEHEDFYDPDFYIYNDVITVSPGGEVTIYGYPESVFPATDNHSATLIGDEIILIGNLGYQNARRPGFTQISILNTKDFSIRMQDSSGANPGWISSHSAELHGNKIKLTGGNFDDGNNFVENIDDWQLDLSNWTWQRLTQRNWPTWDLKRADGSRSQLWEIRMKSWEDRKQEDPQVKLYQKLYLPEIPHELVTGDDDEYNITKVKVDGVIVKQEEDHNSVRVTVQGDLGKTAERIIEDLRKRLEAIEGAPYQARKIR